MYLTLDAIRHPVDTNMVLTWALTLWNEDPRFSPMLLVRENQGLNWRNRIKTILSNTRRGLLVAGEPVTNQFGINFSIKRFEELDGTFIDAVSMTRTVHTRHQFNKLFAKGNYRFDS